MLAKTLLQRGRTRSIHSPLLDWRWRSIARAPNSTIILSIDQPKVNFQFSPVRADSYGFILRAGRGRANIDTTFAGFSLHQLDAQIDLYYTDAQY